MTAELSIDDFPAFFKAVNDDAPPFQWQVRLAREVAGSGVWPDLIDLPTGAGKTATIDVALFLRALRGDQPRRIVFVVDRRVIVHQAFSRALRLREALAKPSNRVVRAVRERLLDCSYDRGGHVPLAVAELRGGIVRDETWAMRPDTPAVLISTVDQVGSRLLFRGYGLSRGMRPVHAGLLGNDVLLLLDEVHLARPFAETLADLGACYRGMGTLPDRWQVVELSATPAKPAATRFGLRDEDREDDTIQRRCGAVKPVELRLVKVKGPDAEAHRKALVEALAAAALELAGRPEARRVGVVVNRVATAAAVQRILAATDDEHEPLLLTGRMRPFDRDDAQAELRDAGWLLGRNREDASAGSARYIVATQSIEAGADLDLDGLVTECAPYDALVQRFGRLDRDGKLSDAGTPGLGVVVATSAQAAGTADDPVYGSALGATWDWLKAHEPLDFGIHGRPAPSEDEASSLRVEPPPAPVLLPTHLDAWVQTAPRPSADPDPDLWLHGLRENPDLDVSVVWRADIGDSLDAWRKEDLIDWVSACPPTSAEAMPVPISALRRWLLGGRVGAADIADVEGAAAPAEGARSADQGPMVLRWRPDDESEVAPVRGVRPGDTIIVPSAFGGVAHRSWAPDSRGPVADLGARSARRRNRLVLRLAPGLFPDAPFPGLTVEDGDQSATDLEAICAWLTSDALGAWLDGEPPVDQIEIEGLRCLRELAVDDRFNGAPVRRLQHPGGLAFVLEQRLPSEGTDSLARAETVDSEPGTSEFTGTPVQQASLTLHLADVAEWAGEMAEKCGLPPNVRDDLALAGRLHDVGKADPRFQQVLAGGGPAPPDLLAKSSGLAPTPAQRRLIQRRAGYPLHARHELLSASLLERCPSALTAAHDPDLVVHLVASHHGHARPGVPVAEDKAPVEVAVPADVAGSALTGSSDHRLHVLDSGVAERFWVLNERYGRYGLAWLESILRLADHRASAERQGDA